MKVFVYILLNCFIKNLSAQNNNAFIDFRNLSQECSKNNEWSKFTEKLDTSVASLRGQNNESILFDIINIAPESVIQKVLKNGVNPNISDSQNNRTVAFHTTDTTKIKLLIKYNLDVNHQDIYGWTAANYNCSNFDALKLYCSNGLNFSLKDNRGRSILFAIIEEYSNERTIQAIELINADNNNTNRADSSGLTPLMYSVIMQRHYVLEYLVQKAANFDSKTTSEIIIPWGNPKLLLHANSSVNHLIEILENFLNQAADNVNGEWIYEKKFNLGISKLILEGMSYNEAFDKMDK